MSDTKSLFKIVKVARTNSGRAAMWESVWKNEEDPESNLLSRVTIITNQYGSPKRAYCYYEDSNRQALVPLYSNDYIVKAFLENDGNYAVSVFFVENVNLNKSTSKITLVLRKEVDEDTWSIYDEKHYSNCEKVIKFAVNQKLQNPDLIYSVKPENFN